MDDSQTLEEYYKNIPGMEGIGDNFFIPPIRRTISMVNFDRGAINKLRKTLRVKDMDVIHRWFRYNRNWDKIRPDIPELHEVGMRIQKCQKIKLPKFLYRGVARSNSYDWGVIRNGLIYNDIDPKRENKPFQVQLERPMSFAMNLEKAKQFGSNGLFRYGVCVLVLETKGLKATDIVPLTKEVLYLLDEFDKSGGAANKSEAREARRIKQEQNDTYYDDDEIVVLPTNHPLTLVARKPKNVHQGIESLDASEKINIDYNLNTFLGIDKPKVKVDKCRVELSASDFGYNLTSLSFINNTSFKMVTSKCNMPLESDELDEDSIERLVSYVTNKGYDFDKLEVNLKAHNFNSSMEFTITSDGKFEVEDNENAATTNEEGEATEYAEQKTEEDVQEEETALPVEDLAEVVGEEGFFSVFSNLGLKLKKIHDKGKLVAVMTGKFKLTPKPNMTITRAGVSVLNGKATSTLLKCNELVNQTHQVNSVQDLEKLKKSLYDKILSKWNNEGVSTIEGLKAQESKKAHPNQEYLKLLASIKAETVESLPRGDWSKAAYILKQRAGNESFNLQLDDALANSTTFDYFYVTPDPQSRGILGTDILHSINMSSTKAACRFIRDGMDYAPFCLDFCESAIVLPQEEADKFGGLVMKYTLTRGEDFEVTNVTDRGSINVRWVGNPRPVETQQCSLGELLHLAGISYAEPIADVVSSRENLCGKLIDTVRQKVTEEGLSGFSFIDDEDVPTYDRNCLKAFYYGNCHSVGLVHKLVTDADEISTMETLATELRSMVTSVDSDAKVYLERNGNNEIAFILEM